MEADPVSPAERDGNHGEQQESGLSSPSRRASDPGPRRARTRTAARNKNKNQPEGGAVDAALNAFSRLPDEIIERSVAFPWPLPSIT